MNESEFTNAFHTKLDDLEKKLDKLDRDGVLKAIQKIKNWLISNPSVIQMRCLQAFYSFVFASYGEKFNDREDFMTYIKNHSRTFIGA